MAVGIWLCSLGRLGVERTADVCRTALMFAAAGSQDTKLIAEQLAGRRKKLAAEGLSRD
jgi:hypothetical protein